jgi:hypothetical protein
MKLSAKFSPAIGIAFFSLAIGAASLQANANANANADSRPDVYLNKNLGFNIKGFKYTQNEFPCDLDKILVENLVEVGAQQRLNIEATDSAAKVRNGSIPVIAIDIEQLVMGEKLKLGTKTRSNLPKVQVAVALVKGERYEETKHSCVIATLNQFSPSSSVLDLGSSTTICSATRKCLRDLSKDIIQWIKPQIK